MNPAEFVNIARAEDSHWWYRGHREILFGLLDSVVTNRMPIRKVLEGGCGTGYNARVLRHRYGWQVTALDLDRTALNYLQSEDTPNLVQGNVSSLPFQTSAFDAVVSLDVLVHLPHPAHQACLQEFARVLRPGGLVVIRAAAFDFLRSRHSTYVHEVQRFTRRRLTKTLEECGFRVLRATYAQTLLLPIAVLKFRIWEPLTRARPQSGLESIPKWLNKLLYVPLAAEARWLASGRDLPAGQSVLLLAEKSP